MKKLSLQWILMAVGVLLGVQQSLGAGFALYEGSARGNALGGTLVGRADDPSALFYNPAGITQLPGLQTMIGLTTISPSMDVDIDGHYYPLEDVLWPVPHFYTTYQVSNRVWLGLGVFSPFGLAAEFDEDWPGRYNNYNAIIQTLTINPTVAYKVTDRVSVAAGFDLMWFDIELDRKIPTGGNTGLPDVGDIDSNLDGDSWGYGFNLGVHYKACDWLALGVAYRSQVKQDVEDARADFSNNGLPPGLFEDTGAGGSVTLPDMVFLGATFYPIDRLSLEVGGIWNRWSTFDDLTVTLDTAAVPGGERTTSVEKDWHDTWIFQVGAEYKVMPWMDLRAGYRFDEEPIPSEHVDYIVPANDRHWYTVGTGFRWCDWTMDLSYHLIYVTERDIEARPEEGVLDSQLKNGHAHLFGLSVGYKF